MKRIVFIFSSVLFLNYSFSQDFSKEEFIGKWSAIDVKIRYMGCPIPKIKKDKFKSWTFDFTKNKGLYLYFTNEGTTQSQELHLRWEQDNFYDNVIYAYDHNDKEVFVIKFTPIEHGRVLANFGTLIFILKKEFS